MHLIPCISFEPKIRVSRSYVKELSKKATTPIISLILLALSINASIRLFIGVLAVFWYGFLEGVKVDLDMVKISLANLKLFPFLEGVSGAKKAAKEKGPDLFTPKRGYSSHSRHNTGNSNNTLRDRASQFLFFGGFFGPFLNPNLILLIRQYITPILTKSLKRSHYGE